MFVKLMHTDNWEGVSNRNEVSEPPSFDEIDRAIRRLNGRNFTMVVLSTCDILTLTVAGGNDGRYLTELTVGEDDEFYILVNAGAGLEELSVVTGGQKGTV